MELPESIFHQQLTRIAELTHQLLEALAVQSITSNLPPSAENTPPQMQAELQNRCQYFARKFLFETLQFKEES